MAQLDRELTLKAAAAMFAGKPSVATVRRWCERGVFVRARGAYVVLESFLDGGRRYTSLARIQHFKRQLNSF